MHKPEMTPGRGRLQTGSGTQSEVGSLVTTQACVAVYPLGQGDYVAVHRAIDALATADVIVQHGNMNTIISGSEEAVFRALRAAYSSAAELGGTVMTVTVSNACPV